MPHFKTPAARAGIVSITIAALAGASTVLASPASAADLEERSLVEVLDADGNTFDKKWNDFDIVHRAATTVLENKPESAVAVLADGSTPLTAFIPNDRAFRRLVFQLTGDRPSREKATFNQVAALGVDTIETVLLYHVVPGSTITRAQAEESDGAALTTAASDLEIQVNVRGHKVWLGDLDEDDRNPRLLRPVTDINEGNKQIAHGITRVLRPTDLP